ncbi:MAG: aldo/keto reductase [Gammaproteobacteria bacterium]|nr:aldo/keto reductase [Gammaproteobacteria bacterium]
MDVIPIGQSKLRSSRLAYGCMRISGDGSQDDRDKGKAAVHAAVDAGYSLFDHADIYGNGACEELFGEVLRESPRTRQQILITGKCGVRFPVGPDDDAPARWDLSNEHIIRSVEGSLGRLGIEQLDLLLLHRPDYLMHTAEVAEAFSALKSSGKVGHFGVSNFSTSQVDLLQSAIPDPLLINQVEINVHNISALSDGVLDQCLRLGMTPQAWCPIAGVAYPAWGNTFSDEDDIRIRQELGRQSEIYGVDDWIIALAWLLKHPAMISPIIGSTNPSRIAAATAALDVDYGREDWYRLIEARNGQPVP